MNEVAIEKTMTTKELADVLGVSAETIRTTAKAVIDPSKQIWQVINGGKSMVFNESQATAIKIELQNHSKIASNGFSTLSINSDLEMMLVQQKLAVYQNQRIAELTAQNEIMKPKADVYDICCTSDNLHEIGELGKKTGIGERKIFSFLVAEKVIKYKHVDGIDFYEPCYPYDKYFDFTLQTFPKGNEIKTRNKLMLTTEGFMYFTKKYSIKNELPTKCRQLTYSETSEK